MRLNNIFTEENMHEREAYRGELKKLLGHYQGKKTKSLHIRLLEGIKAKHLVRFEARKQKMEAEKMQTKFGTKVKQEAFLRKMATFSKTEGKRANLLNERRSITPRVIEFRRSDVKMSRQINEWEDNM